MLMLKDCRSRLYTRWFGWYSRRQIRQHFNALRVFLDPGVLDMDSCIPVVFYCNHAYWWDGFWSQLCTEEFFRQNLYIVIEQAQLRRYRFFTRLGAFSIDRSHARSALQTLDYAAERLMVASERQNALWIFPQGCIEHVDKRPLVFYKGTAGIVSRVLRNNCGVYLVSVVSRIEYLQEQKPELLLSFKTPELVLPGDRRTAGELTSTMRQRTEVHLDELKEKVVGRLLGPGKVVIRGTESVNRKVDRYRRFFGFGGQGPLRSA